MSFQTYQRDCEIPFIKHVEFCWAWFWNKKFMTKFHICDKEDVVIYRYWRTSFYSNLLMIMKWNKKLIELEQNTISTKSFGKIALSIRSQDKILKEYISYTEVWYDTIRSNSATVKLKNCRSYFLKNTWSSWPIRINMKYNLFFH